MPARKLPLETAATLILGVIIIFSSVPAACAAEQAEDAIRDLSAVYTNEWVEKNRDLFHPKRELDTARGMHPIVYFILGLFTAFLIGLGKKYRIWEIKSTLVNLDGLNCRLRAELHARWGGR